VRLAVTGREGQLVRSLVEVAADEAGVEVIPVGRPDFDLLDPDRSANGLRSLAPDAIVNAAAYTAVDEAESERDLAFRINADGPAALARIARDMDIPFIQISTDYVFDGRKDEPYSEDDLTNPLGVYGRSKLEGEERVRAEQPQHLIIRTAWVYSPFGRNFLKTMAGLAGTRDEVAVVNDQHGSPTSALDLAKGLGRIFRCWTERNRTGLGETYHLTGSGEATWSGFAEEILRACESMGVPHTGVRPITTEEWPTKAVRPRNSRLDCSKFAADFDFRMPQWQESTREVVGRVISATSKA
jgi:dTDP-4-dehydrorhamnose reductase